MYKALSVSWVRIDVSSPAWKSVKTLVSWKSLEEAVEPDPLE